MHQFLHGGFDGLPRAGEERLDVRASDHRAHDAFANRLYGALGALHVEQIIADAVRLDLPQHREVDVHDVLVTGQHQAFFRHIAQGAAAAQIEADVNLVDAQRLRRQRGLDRIGQMIVEAGLHLADEFAEPQHYAELVGLDAEESGKAPQCDGGERDQRNAAAAEIARQETAQHALAAAEKFL